MKGNLITYQYVLEPYVNHCQCPQPSLQLPLLPLNEYHDVITDDNTRTILFDTILY